MCFNNEIDVYYCLLLNDKQKKKKKLPAILFPFGKIFLSSPAVLTSSLANLDAQRDFDESMLFACKVEACIGLPTRISSRIRTTPGV